jgi:hypothetical protein
MESLLLSHAVNKRHDTEHIGIRLNDNHHKGLLCDTQRISIELNDTQHKGLMCDTQQK